MTAEPTERDFGIEMQAAAEAHLAACWEAFYVETENDDEYDGEALPSPAIGPFCGCETCVVREVLAGAWPVIESLINEGR
jgi:hypothetical protein